jgi:hypothetical protein
MELTHPTDKRLRAVIRIAVVMRLMVYLLAPHLF